jgi:hypothetical protein
MLATNALGFNTAMCKTNGPFYQKPQPLFDDFKNTCTTLTGQDKKMADLSSSISTDTNSVNTFSAPLVTIANWFSTTRSAICGAAVTATPAAPAATTAPSS